MLFLAIGKWAHPLRPTVQWHRKPKLYMDSWIWIEWTPHYGSSSYLLPLYWHCLLKSLRGSRLSPSVYQEDFLSVCFILASLCLERLMGLDEAGPPAHDDGWEYKL